MLLSHNKYMWTILPMPTDWLNGILTQRSIWMTDVFSFVLIQKILNQQSLVTHSLVRMWFNYCVGQLSTVPGL